MDIMVSQQLRAPAVLTCERPRDGQRRENTAEDRLPKGPGQHRRLPLESKGPQSFLTACDRRTKTPATPIRDRVFQQNANYLLDPPHRHCVRAAALARRRCQQFRLITWQPPTRRNFADAIAASGVSAKPQLLAHMAGLLSEKRNTPCWTTNIADVQGLKLPKHLEKH